MWMALRGWKLWRPDSFVCSVCESWEYARK